MAPRTATNIGLRSGSTRGHGGVCRPGVIDESFSPAHDLPQHHVQLLSPTLVEFAKAAVSIAIRVHLPVFFPGQLQRQVRVALEFFVKLGIIWLRLAGLIDVPRRASKYGCLQLAIIPAFGQRPTDSCSLGAFQVLANGTLPIKRLRAICRCPSPRS